MDNLFSYFADTTLSLFDPIVEMLPMSDGLPYFVISSTDYYTCYFFLLNHFLPISELFLIFCIIIPIQIIFWSIQLFLKILSIVRGVDTGSSNFNIS